MRGSLEALDSLVHVRMYQVDQAFCLLKDSLEAGISRVQKGLARVILKETAYPLVDFTPAQASSLVGREQYLNVEDCGIAGMFESTIAAPYHGTVVLVDLPRALSEARSESQCRPDCDPAE